MEKNPSFKFFFFFFVIWKPITEPNSVAQIWAHILKPNPKDSPNVSETRN